MDRRWPSDAEAAVGRPRPRAATLGHAAVRAQEFLRVNHFRYPHARARGARRRFQIAVSFFSFSGATPAMPRLAALAAAGAGGGAQSRPSYAVAAEGRSRLRAAVGGLRRVLALDFQVGFPAGAVGLFSSRPARAIYFLWIGDGRATPRLRLAARAPAPPAIERWPLIE